ncbi:MAG: AI-2E family transporter [Actinobacteria bacterium]|nr:AI-2E family transporter [Actinomycetota bacterium]
MDQDQAVSGRVARAVPFGLWVAGAVAGIVVLIGLAVRSVNSALAPVAPVVIAITIALLLTALLEPLRRLVQRTGLTQGTSAALTMLIFLLGLTGTFWLTGAQIASGAQDLVDGVSNGLDAVQEWLKTGPLGISGDQIANWIAQGRDWLQSNWSSLAGGVLQAGGAISTFSVVLLLALVSTYFFLAQGRTIWLWFIRLLPLPTQQPLHDSFRRGWLAVLAYSRTQIIVAAVDALGIGLGALLLGVPLVVPIALLTFLMAFIPVVGAVLSGVVAVLIAFASNGFTAALIMVAVVLAVQQIESNVLQPVLMSRAVDIHPWAVIIGVTVFSYLWGVMGALVSVPVMAMAKVVVLNLRGHDIYPQLGTDPVLPYGEGPTSPDEPLVPDEEEAPPS